LVEKLAWPKEERTMTRLPRSDRDFATRPMFSVCLPEGVAAAFRAEADRENLNEWTWLTCLLEMSFNDFWVIESVGDCPNPLPVNLQVRLQRETIRRLRYFSEITEISPTAYVQRLLYHVYVTREIVHSEKKTIDTIFRADMRTSSLKFRRTVND
jgi:hypothetical protein